MTREQFKRRYADDWARLERLLLLLDARHRRLGMRRWLELSGDADVAEFDRLYRLVCRHLALSRLRLYGVDLEDYLNDLALRAHHRFYGNRRADWRHVVSFVTDRFPRTVRARWRLVLLAAALFVGPAVAIVTAMIADPDLIHAVMAPERVRELEEMYDPQSGFRTAERAADSNTAMFGFYVMNNVGVAFQTFGGGILFGAGSAFFLAFNGIVLGAVGAYLTQAGFGETFFPFVAGHSAPELTAIVLAGAAGINLGWAVLAPGRRGRATALRIAGLESVTLILGVAGMLVLAAAVEAYWSASASVPDPVKYIFAAVLWSLTLAYFGLAGRRGGP